VVDHPLSRATDSVWNTFYKDQELWDEIEKDVKRTRSDMEYFYLCTDPARNTSSADLMQLQRQHDTKKQDLKPEHLKNYLETHEDNLHRVLFIYAKLNPGIKYVQGMNEVLAVLYYCFLIQDPNCVVSNKYFESDLFFTF
jgi:TBC1 domain family member 13